MSPTHGSGWLTCPSHTLDADKPLKSPRVEKDVRSHDESATIRSLKSENTKAGAPGMDRLFSTTSNPLQPLDSQLWDRDR